MITMERGRTSHVLPVAWVGVGVRLVALLVACSSLANAEERAAQAASNPQPSIAPSQLASAATYSLGEYHWFHEHPELANQERETAARLAAALQGFGFSVHAGIGGTGVVATLEGQKPGKGATVLYRADMDGLPVSEQTKLAYSSKAPGVMHACGHDLHVATALGALRIMADTRGDWSGTLVFVGQPAEEGGAGARQMLADPNFQRILARAGKPRLALALHDSADLPVGQVGVSGGYTTANVDSIDLVLHGRDGHGARPQQTVDPIVMAAEVVLQLQTIVSRRIPPEEPAVVTVGKFHAGTTYNIIPATAELMLTVRSYDDDIRRTLLSEIEHIARSVAESYHAPSPPTFTLRKEFTPSNLNDEAWSRRLAARFQELLGTDRVVGSSRSMVGDDFARFGRDLGIPAVYWRLGAVAPKAFAQRATQPLPSLHSATWAPDARGALPIGIQTVVAAIHEGLSGTP
jgi:amidohydrolase